MNHFKDLFANTDTDDSVQDASQFDNSEESDHFLNEEITELEDQKAIKKLKIEKACGLDGITAEMLKAGGQDVVLFLTLGCLMYCLKRVFTYRIGPRKKEKKT